MSISARIRKAALGPTPRPFAQLRFDWIGTDDVLAVGRRLGTSWCLDGGRGWPKGTITERRMCLLFVAEALESERS